MNQNSVLFFLSFFALTISCSELKNTIDLQGVINYTLLRAVQSKSIQDVLQCLGNGADPQAVILGDDNRYTTALNQAFQQLDSNYWQRGCPIINALNNAIIKRRRD